jgi:hypothetical protein
MLTILVTCLLVWAALRWFGIDFGDFRMRRDARYQSEKGAVRGSGLAVDAGTEEGSQSQREGALWRRRKPRGPDKHADLA